MIVETQPVPLSTVSHGQTVQTPGDTERVYLVGTPIGFDVPPDHRLMVALYTGEVHVVPASREVILRQFKAVPVA